MTSKLVRMRGLDGAERQAVDVVEIRSEVAESPIRSRSTSCSLRSESAPPTQRTRPEVYDAYLKGRYYGNRRSPDGFRERAGGAARGGKTRRIRSTFRRRWRWTTR